MSNLEKEALNLPKKDRIALIRKLLQSLEPYDQPYLNEWIQESENRLTAYEVGEMESFSESEALQWLERMRAGQVD